MRVCAHPSVLIVKLNPRKQMTFELKISIQARVGYGEVRHARTVMEAIHMGYFSAMNI